MQTFGLHEWWMHKLQTSMPVFPFPYPIPIFTARFAPRLLKPASPRLHSQVLCSMLTRSTCSVHTSPSMVNCRTNYTCTHTPWWEKAAEIKASHFFFCKYKLDLTVKIHASTHIVFLRPFWPLSCFTLHNKSFSLTYGLGFHYNCSINVMEIECLCSAKNGSCVLEGKGPVHWEKSPLCHLSRTLYIIRLTAGILCLTVR